MTEQNQIRHIHLRNIFLHLTFMASNDRDSQSNSNMWHTKLKRLLKELRPTLLELFEVNKIWFFLSWKMKLNCALSQTFDGHSCLKTLYIAIAWEYLQYWEGVARPTRACKSAFEIFQSCRKNALHKTSVDKLKSFCLRLLWREGKNQIWQP